MKVPEDISITGFDDNVYGKMIRPKLTTVHQNAGQKAFWAIEYLQKMLNGENLGTVDRFLSTELVIRDSVRAV